MRFNRGGNVRFHFACAQVEQASFTRTASEVSRLFSCPFSQCLVAKLILSLFEIARVLGRHLPPFVSVCHCRLGSKETESLHPMTKKIILSITFSGLFALTRICSAQTLTPLVRQSPGGANLAFQLTDGTVMCQSDSSNEWYKLTPDNTGSYVNGTWTQLASLQPGYVPDAFASAVLADGRVVITGGEYNNDQFALTNLGAVYDPIGNTWTPLAAPPGWDFIGDSPSVVLPDGRFVVGRKLDMQVAALDPATLTWTLLGSLGKSDFNAEEGWTLLPDGTVLTFDVQNAPNSEIYNSSTQSWQSAGSTIVDLHSPSPFGCIPYGPNGKYCYYPPGEVGPGILLADGRVFCTGSYSTTGPGHTAIYSPSTATWAVGPDFPNGDNAGDSFAALLPNGNALVEADSGNLYEFDGTNLNPTLSAFGALMVLPTGQVLVSNGTFTQVYTPANTSSRENGRPRLSSFRRWWCLGRLTKFPDNSLTVCLRRPHSATN